MYSAYARNEIFVNIRSRDFIALFGPKTHSEKRNKYLNHSNKSHVYINTLFCTFMDFYDIMQYFDNTKYKLIPTTRQNVSKLSQRLRRFIQRKMFWKVCTDANWILDTLKIYFYLHFAFIINVMKLNWVIEDESIKNVSHCNTFHWDSVNNIHLIVILITIYINTQAIALHV